MGCEVDFEGGEGGDGAEGCMAATTTVVEGFDVIEESQASSLFGRERLLGVRKFGFEGGEGAFSEGTVVAVASRAHALKQLMFVEEVTG